MQRQLHPQVHHRRYNKQLISYCVTVLSRLNYCISLLMGTPNRWRKSRVLLHALFSECHAIKTVHLSDINSLAPNFWTNPIQNCLHVFNAITAVLPPLIVLTYCSPSRSLPSSSDTHVLKLNASTAKPMAVAFFSHRGDRLHV